MNGNDLVRVELGRLVDDVKQDLEKLPRHVRDRAIGYINRLQMILDGILQRENDDGIDR